MSVHYGKLLLCFFLGIISYESFGQINNSSAYNMEAERDRRFAIGGYAQLDYNQRFATSTSYAGKLDPHRIVLFLGYQFSPKIHFVTELEVEHGNEFYVEQAYLNMKLNNVFQFRAGVMLIPMGLTNEYHEPTTFNGVERPSIASIIIPTTWREMGVGVHGRLSSISLNYQMYLFTGFNGYDTGQRLNGTDGFRKGRQKALNSYITAPNLSAKVNYYGINNLNIGLSGYFGKSQSKMFDKLDRNSHEARLRADSTVVNIAMLGIDAQYRLKGLELRGEYIHTFIGNTNQYNTFEGSRNDLGSQMQGWYLEASYDLLYHKFRGQRRLVSFVRWESYDTHFRVEDIDKNPNYNFSELFVGIGYSPVKGVILKMDYQHKINFMNTSLNQNWINCGIGLNF